MAESSSTDDGRVDLKKRARRRLVGAVALALLAVIVLPMVMEQEPKPLSQDIQIRIPSQDSAAPAVRAPVRTPAPDAAPPAVAEVKSEPKPQTSGESKPESKPETAKPTPPSDLVKAPEQAKQQAVEAKPETSVASKAEAKAETRPEPKSPAKADTQREQWVVQLGAYQEQGNVKVLLAKVKELGYPAYIEKVDTEHGTRTRVRAGPFATREKAEKAQASLKRIGAGGPSGGIVGPK